MNIRCAHCKGRHTSVAEVRDCLAEMEWQAAEARAEMEVEARNERYWEERGGAEPEDPREIEAQMRDDERRFDAMIQARERAEDLRVAEDKARRDAAFAAQCEGGVCHGMLEQCSKHSLAYQNRWGRAANE